MQSLNYKHLLLMIIKFDLQHNVCHINICLICGGFIVYSSLYKKVYC